MIRTAAGLYQWTPDDIRAMHPWLPPDQLLKLVALACPQAQASLEKPPAMIRMNPKRRVPYIPYDPVYSRARAEHAFLLRCEGHTWKKIGERIGCGGQRAMELSHKFAWQLTRRMAKLGTAWRMAE